MTGLNPLPKSYDFRRLCSTFRAALFTSGEKVAVGSAGRIDHLPVGSVRIAIFFNEPQAG